MRSPHTLWTWPAGMDRGSIYLNSTLIAMRQINENSAKFIISHSQLHGGENGDQSDPHRQRLMLRVDLQQHIRDPGRAKAHPPSPKPHQFSFRHNSSGEDFAPCAPRPAARKAPHTNRPARFPRNTTRNTLSIRQR